MIDMTQEEFNDALTEAREEACRPLEARIAELENALRFCWDQGIDPMCVPVVKAALKVKE